jgi:hypothetical protein
MDGCYSYREIDLSDPRIDPNRVRSLNDFWGVIITKEGKIKIPFCSYDDIFPLIRKKPDI